MAEVTLERVCKTYAGGVRALRDFSLAVPHGQFVVLLGPSGCGKTTALRLIAGLDQVSSGVVRIGGRVVNDTPSHLRDVAMVFQEDSVYPHLTVQQNLGLGLRLRRQWSPAARPWRWLVSAEYRRRARAEREHIETRVREAAAVLGIGGLLRRYPAALSGGQRQRVAVGRAVVRQPAVFLLDEPLASLEARLREDLRRELRRLQRHVGVTTLYVTHDQEEAMTLADRLAVMCGGAVRQVAAPLDVYDHPVDRDVAGLVGAPPINLLEARLAFENGAHRVYIDQQAFDLPAALREALAPHAGERMTLGVRPDALWPAAGDAGPAIRAVVQAVETLGDRVHVVAEAPRLPRLVCRCERGGVVRRGEAFRLVPDLERAHYFAADTGRNLLAR